MPVLSVIINPIAGLGGAAGLKGTDSPQIIAEARAREAVAQAPRRMREALGVVAASGPGSEVIAAAGAMGEATVRAAGLAVSAVVGSATDVTTAADTRRAAAAMLER